VVVVVVVAVAAFGGLALYLSCRDDSPPTKTVDAPQLPPPPPPPIAPPIPPAPPEPAPESAFGLQPQPSEHYLLYSRAPEALKADVLMRLEALNADLRREMASVLTPYHDKTKAFFIGDESLFVEAGGEPYAPGVFRVLVDQDGNPADGVGPRLILRHDGNELRLDIVQLMQHEAWHQFNWHHVTEWSPIWLDEGLGHYYQYSIWTGDMMIHGGIHVSMWQMLRESVSSFVPLRQLMDLDDPMWQAWRDQTSFFTPYLESWSLIHFLKYADGGAHEPLFEAYLADVAAGRDRSGSAEAITAMEGEYLQWIQSLQISATHGRFLEAMAATLAGHLVRCHLNGQRFNSMDDFLAAADAGTLALGPVGSDTWLPASVMSECRSMMGFFTQFYGSSQYGAPQFQLEVVNGLPTAVIRMDSLGLHVRGVASVSGGRVTGVTVQGLETIQPGMR